MSLHSTKKQVLITRCENSITCPVTPYPCSRGHVSSCCVNQWRRCCQHCCNSHNARFQYQPVCLRAARSVTPEEQTWAKVCVIQLISSYRSTLLSSNKPSLNESTLSKHTVTPWQPNKWTKCFRSSCGQICSLHSLSQRAEERLRLWNALPAPSQSFHSVVSWKEQLGTCRCLFNLLWTTSSFPLLTTFCSHFSHPLFLPLWLYWTHKCPRRELHL